MLLPLLLVINLIKRLISQDNMIVLIRKNINLGILRINFSKSGVGFSVGIPGFRIVKPVKGKPYFQMGKNGFYYRKTIK